MMRPGRPAPGRSTIALLAGLAVDNYGSGLFLPLAVLYATRVVGLDLNVAGGLVATATVLGFAVPPIAGRLTHRFGPRLVVVAAQIVQGAGAVVYLLAGNGVSVFAAAALLAAGAQMFYCSVFVLIADVSTSTRKERPFARVGMVRAGAFGLGTLTSAVVLTQRSDAALRVLVGLDALTFVAAAVVLAVLVDTERVDHDAGKAVGPLRVLRDRSYLTLMASTCLLGLAIDFALIGTPVFVLDVLDGPSWVPGALLATGTALSSVLGVRVVDAIRGVRRTRSIQAGGGLYATWALLMMLMTWWPAEWLAPYAFVTWLLLVAGNKVFYPVSGALAEALPPRDARAGYMATYQYAYTTAQVLAPAVVALFAVSAWLPWAVVAASALLGVRLIGHLGSVIPATVDRIPAVAEKTRV
jgi:MFS family permease